MEKEKSIYFFVTYFTKQKENDIDIDFVVPEKKDLWQNYIFVEDIYKNHFIFIIKYLRLLLIQEKVKKEIIFILNLK